MSKTSEYSIRTALIALDTSEMDENLIRTVNYLHSILPFKSLHIVHVVEKVRIPTSMKKDYPDLITDKEILAKQILDVFNSHFDPGDSGLKIKVKILKGNPTREIIHYANDKKVDLIVLGRKRTLKGSGIVKFRVSRGASCSILVVPEAPIEKIERVLLPVEFNETSRRAYKAAEKLASDHGNLSFMHLYHVPVGYSKTGKTYEEFDSIMPQNAQKDYEKFSKRIEMHLTPDVKFVNGDKHHAEELILDYAKDVNADILVMGSKSRSAPAYTLLGSVTEKVLHLNDHFPLLIIRKPNENMGFIELLKRI